MNEDEKTTRVRLVTTDSDHHPIVVELKVRVEHIEKNYVTKQEFAPVKTIAYGIAGLGLSSIFLALLKIVILN